MSTPSPRTRHLGERGAKTLRRYVAAMTLSEDDPKLAQRVTATLREAVAGADHRGRGRLLAKMRARSAALFIRAVAGE